MRDNATIIEEIKKARDEWQWSKRRFSAEDTEFGSKLIEILGPSKIPERTVKK